MPNTRAPHQDGTCQSDVPGQAGRVIGTGRYAKDGIAYLTIKLTVGAAAFVTMVLVVRGICTGVWPTTEEILNVWGTFLPVFMLVLGYYFGRQR